MRILVVGAGATGGYFGARLAQAGQDVTFLLREKRALAVQRDGLTVHSPHGDFHFQPSVLQASQLTGPYDLILLTVKSFGLEAAIKDIAPVVGEDTMILPVLNGMKHIETLSQRFGEHALLGGLCKINATLDADGHIHQMTPMHQIYYGELSGEKTARIQRVDQAFKEAGFEAFLSETIMTDLWEKWLLLCSFGAITCTMHGNIGQVASAPGGTEFATGIVNEALTTMKAFGYAERAAAVAKVKEAVTDKHSEQTSSMYRDMTQGNPVEADQIVGDLVERAIRVGINVPLLQAAYTHLCVYQKNRQNA
ncbi:2-dehydropantoate 2-reductase [Rahnella rivi]|uniref:2-dehydropantoate 2-reductase n=1 Tax=Rahnella TaxID=34037 RepID=UPI001C264065|nr:2-dehydropantoate 2-reductase [Rahnella rivi]MBU9831777.1 2-dehydropantoate 2-reductase [Rahnella rivi]